MSDTRFRQLVVAGNANEAAMATMREMAARLGLIVLEGDNLLQPSALLKLRQQEGPEPTPRWTDSELSDIKLKTAIKPREGHEAISFYAFLAANRLKTAADLVAMSFEDCMHTADGITPSTVGAALVLKFMIDNRLRFTDLNPAQVFVNHIEESPEYLSVRARNCLLREGLRWAELVALYSGEELTGGLRNFGKMSLDEVKAYLAEFGLYLKDEEH